MNRNDALALYRLGLAVHWLKPKSKIPIGHWADSKKRKSFKELKEEFERDFNMGVRLGTPSAFEVGGETFFPVVIDCDCKSDDARHREEMEECARKAFPTVFKGKAARVWTGRGNGSAHVYALTRQKAVVGGRVGQSAEKVKIKMPSVKPSSVEKETLTEDELKAGWRLRPAWEVSLMGEGRQVVVPPSIHPDTGRTYLWAPGGPGDLTEWPVLTAREASYGEVTTRPKTAFKWKIVENFDLNESSLDTAQILRVTEGEGVEGDRSAALFSSAMAMVRAGLTDDEILTVLTDEGNYLGQVAYDHTQSNDRDRAAKWVFDYTLRKAKETVSGARDFDDAVEVGEVELTDDGAKEQKKELVGDDWTDAIERIKDDPGAPPKSTLLNVETILRGAMGKNVFRYNAFTQMEIYGKSTPWGGVEGEGIKDSHLGRMQSWFAREWRFEPGLDKINVALTNIAAENEFHPVRDYLNELEWDGSPRIDTWLADYLGARAPKENRAYLTAVSRKILIAMVARAYEPGVKFDYVVILEGRQGMGKSTALRYLASDEWFSDATINVTDKDGVLAIGGHWLMEMGELSSLKKSDVDQLKEFISRTTDKIRKPYGRRVEDLPRQCVFIGTTNNEDGYLRDLTGNRRYWPIELKGKCDFSGIKKNRDQLFAEARVYYEMGEELYLSGKDENEAAERIQKSKLVSDVYEDRLHDFFEAQLRLPKKERGFSLDSFQIKDLFGDFGPLASERCGLQEQHRAGAALKKLECERTRVFVRGHYKRYWKYESKT